MSYRYLFALLPKVTALNGTFIYPLLPKKPMRTFFTAVFLLLFTATLPAQSDGDIEHVPYREGLKIGIGPSHISSAPGLTVQSEYSVSLGRYFELLADLSLAHASDGLKNETRTYAVLEPTNNYAESVHYSFMSLGASICLTPLKTYRHRILLGGGINYCILVETSSVLNGLQTPATFGQSNDQSNGFAFNAIVGYELNVSERLLMGLKASGIYYKENTTALMLSVGYRFE
jgi:hypothetical protein